MAYNDSPDRRPLLYGFAALLILVAAGFLFWPRGNDVDEPGMVLTPDTGQQQQLASEMQTTTEATQSAQMESETTGSTEAAPERIESQPITETEYAVEARGSSPSATSTSPESRSTSTRSAPRATDLDQPGPSGRYLIYLGSFSSRENAQRRAGELQEKGIPAEIASGTKADGSPVYRIRVGYFEGHSRAQNYGEQLKARHQLDYWIAER